MTRKGRPRSEESSCSILETALRLARTQGYANVTMDGIATQAGVGKQTIYRWWRSKAAVVLEALRENARMEIEVPDTGSLHADLEGFLKSTFATISRRPGIDGVLRAMMAEAQHDPEFSKAFRHEVIEPRRAVLRSLFERAQARGELVSPADMDLWVSTAFGLMWYRLLAGDEPPDEALATRLADMLAHVSTRPR